MSSTFSLANQKLKQFFGASQTKDFNLESEKDVHYSGSSKINNFIEALKQYSTIFQSLPRSLEKLYKTFSQLSPKQMYYDSAEYQNHFQKIIEDAKIKANSIYDRYFFFSRQVAVEQEQIKKLEKEFQVIRQRYDHYKSKVDKLTKQFATIQNNPKAYKQSKEQIDRNIGKLTHSQAEYNKELVKMRAKLQNYHINFTDMAFSCFQLFSDDLIGFIISSAKQADSIRTYLQKKRNKQKRNNIVKNNQVAIETLFTKHKIDFFPEVQNIFVTNPKVILSAKKQTPSIKDNNVKVVNSQEKSKSIKVAFDQFNFFKEDKKQKVNPSIVLNKKVETKKTTKNNMDVDLLGIL